MRRSKEIITQAIRLIILISIILFFLQSNICKTIRSAFSTYIFSFHGKCETISNIFIGILSSGILLIFSEIINLNNILANVLDNVSKDYLNGKKWTFINYLEAENNVHSIMEKTIFRIKKLSIDDRMHLDDVEGFFKEQKEQINK